MSLVVLILMVLSSEITGQPDRPAGDARSDLLANLGSPDFAVRSKAVGAMLQEREDLIKRLIEIASGQDAAELDTPSERHYGPRQSAI